MNIKGRRLENLHVCFWLLKDASWCQHWVLVGLVMAIPTLFLAARLVYDSRGDAEEMAHAIATVLWISANIVWMVGEFFFDDGIRWAARPFFFGGIGLLAVFYAWRAVKPVKERLL